jgi:hypothetical protein
LYKLTFNSLSNPPGGTIHLVVDAASLTGTDGATARSFDNITVDASGRVVVQEDPGNTSYNAKTWRVNPAAVPVVSRPSRSCGRIQEVHTGRSGFRRKMKAGVIGITDLVQKQHWSGAVINYPRTQVHRCWRVRSSRTAALSDRVEETELDARKIDDSAGLKARPTTVNGWQLPWALSGPQALYCYFNNPATHAAPRRISSAVPGT